MVGPTVAHPTRLMTRQLIGSILLVSFWAVSGVAQERDLTITQRARLLEPLILESAARYQIDARVLWSLCFVESRFRLDAVSPKGARGPMQFMPETAARYGLRNPHDPKTAIDAAGRYLRDLLQRFGGRVDLALAAYNAGEGAVESFLTGRPLVWRTGKIINARGMVTGGIPPYRETQNYVNAIMRMSYGSSVSQRANRDRLLTRPSPVEKNSSRKLLKRSSESSFIEVEP